MNDGAKKYCIYVGACEQFKYTRYCKNEEELNRSICEIINREFNEIRTFKKIPPKRRVS